VPKIDYRKLWKSLQKALLDLAGLFAVIGFAILLILGANAVLTWLGPWSILFIALMVVGYYTLDYYDQDNNH
jgi:hypothetical protein